MSGLQWAAPRTWGVGDIATATMLNAQRDELTFLSSPPIGRFNQASAQTILHATLTPLSFDTNVLDSYSGHSTSTNNDKYFVQAAGYYRVSGSYSAAQNGTGIRLTEVAVNAGQIVDSSIVCIPPSGWTSNIGTGATIVQASVGDYFQILAYQTSGGPLLTQGGGNCGMTIELIHV